MQKQEKYAYWQMLSDYDLDTVKVLIDGERWIYVAYLCQQAVERQLKGMYVYYTNKEAPKTHNISFLFKKIIATPAFIDEVDHARFDPSVNDCEDYLIDAMYYFISDYPFSYKNVMARFVEKDVAMELYRRTMDTINWLRSFQPPVDPNVLLKDKE
ncbi:MAG: HEPN domain-containing protein [Bacillota bacterium]|nr:HEPN domain-containing protein [Bacillota bacterium]